MEKLNNSSICRNHRIICFLLLLLLQVTGRPSYQVLNNRSVYAFVLGPFDPLGTPVWNPFLNFRGISFMVRIRPVPVVFLLLAFMPQLSVIVSQSSIMSYILAACVPRTDVVRFGIGYLKGEKVIDWINAH